MDNVRRKLILVTIGTERVKWVSVKQGLTLLQLLYRACIQLNLPDDIAMQVDCLVYSPSNGEASSREVMHVQSISNWAPANIGPYSQATKVIRRVICVEL